MRGNKMINIPFPDPSQRKMIGFFALSMRTCADLWIRHGFPIVRPHAGR